MRHLTLLSALFLLIPSLLPAQHMKGYNVAHLFHPFPQHEVNAQAIRLFDALSPDVFRFPGGTVANKYHFHQPGYGFNKADERQPHNFAVDFVKVVRSMKEPPKVVYVMNLLDHFKGADDQALIEENIDGLKYLVSEGMDVIAVELGNEFYLYPEVTGGSDRATVNPELNNEVEIGEESKKKGNWLMRWLRTLTQRVFGSGQETVDGDATYNARFIRYEELCKAYADRIRAIDPDIRLGIPLGNLMNRKHTEYNEYVLSRFDFVDAYVCHFYGTYDKSCDPTDEACIRKGLEWYVRQQLRPRLDRVRETGKEAWVTEWNALKFGHYGDQDTELRNSPIHQEYTRRFIELFDEYGVTISNFHKIVGPMENAAYNAIDVDERGVCHPTPIYDVLLKYY